MNPHGVANMMWALAMLDMPSTGSLREVLWAATEREAPRMNWHEAANSMFVFSLFYLFDTGSSSQVTGRLFECAAQMNEDLGFGEKRQMRPALYPVCLLNTSACGT
jgi:hypothetical protein